jgi:hypothetical protein
MQGRGSVAALAFVLTACAAPSRAPVQTQTPEDAKAKSDVFRALAGDCDLEAIKARAAPPPGSDAPEPPAHAEPNPEPFEPLVYAELAVFVLPTATLAEKRFQPGALAQDPAVALIGVPHLLAKPAEPTRVALSQHIGPLARPSLRELVATIVPANDGKHSVELEITLQLPTGSNAGAVVPPERQVRFVLAPPERSVIQVDAPVPNWPDHSLLALFELHSVREQADLRALFVCKLERQRGR